MEKKKVTKLVLKKTAVANLDGYAMNLLKGGSDGESTFCRDNTDSNKTKLSHCINPNCPS